MAKISMNKEIYDSQARGKVFADTFKAFWDYRELILLLVKRDIAVRYKRSLLGLLWTLLNPLLTSLVLWFVFINIFSAKLPDGTQFAPYLLAGVLLITFFSQGFNQAADSIALGSGILMKIYVPPQVFAFAGAVSNAVNFCFGLFALAFISLITGDGISLFFPATILVIFSMLMYVTGLGLLVSIAYVRYDDTRSIFAILISFMMYLSPIFYPKEILGETMLAVVNANPLTSFLDVFRYVFSNTGSASWADWAYMGGFSAFILIMGIRSFAKAWPRTVVMM
jgi:ABC-2 type transport system permease protein/lipopolysaccharide transport system permease protein